MKTENEKPKLKVITELSPEAQDYNYGSGSGSCGCGCGCGCGISKGRGDGSDPDNCMSKQRFSELCAKGELKSGVFVCGWGYTIPEITVIGSGNGSSGSGGCGCGCGSCGSCGCGSCGCGSCGSCGCGSCGSCGSGGCGCGCGCGGTLGEQALARAREYEGTPYVPGGTSKAGMDCSGLIIVAYQLPNNSSQRWTTQYSLIPYGFDSIPATEHTLKSVAQCGDVFVWKNEHAAIYVGGDSIYHAHSSGVSQTGDLMRYWVIQKGCPAVYRKR